MRLQHLSVSERPTGPEINPLTQSTFSVVTQQCSSASPAKKPSDSSPTKSSPRIEAKKPPSPPRKLWAHITNNKEIKGQALVSESYQKIQDASNWSLGNDNSGKSYKKQINNLELTKQILGKKIDKYTPRIKENAKLYSEIVANLSECLNNILVAIDGVHRSAQQKGMPVYAHTQRNGFTLSASSFKDHSLSVSLSVKSNEPVQIQAIDSLATHTTEEQSQAPTTQIEGSDKSSALIMVT